MPHQELPVELWHRICSFCDRAVLLSLRLVSYWLGAVADEHFLRKVSLSFAEDEFVAIEKLVQNRRIAKHIVKLRFQADRLPALPSYVVWNESRQIAVEQEIWGDVLATGVTSQRQLAGDGLQVDSQQESSGSCPDAEQEYQCDCKITAALPKAFCHYQCLLRQQESMIANRRTQSCFEKLFAACPKLGTVVIAAQGILGSYNGSVRTHSRSIRQAQINQFGDKDGFSIGVEPFNAVLLAAYAANKAIKSLRVESLSLMFFDQNDRTMSRLFASISWIEELYLALNSDLLYEYSQGGYAINYLEIRGIFRFLAAAVSLRCLCIIAPHEVAQDRLELNNIVGSTTWIHLTSLRLSNFVCQGPDLTKLLLGHKKTLERLHLSGVHFTLQTWQTCLASFAGELPHLHWVRLMGWFSDSVDTSFGLGNRKCFDDYQCFKCRYAKRLEKYVKNGGPFPPEPKVYKGYEEDDECLENVSETDEDYS